MRVCRTLAASAVSIFFGSFKRGYEILDRNIRIVRDPYSNKPYVNFYTTKRLSGMLLESKAIGC